MKNTAAEGLLLGTAHETVQKENEHTDFWVSILCHYQWMWCLEGVCDLEEMSDPLKYTSPTSF